MGAVALLLGLVALALAVVVAALVGRQRSAARRLRAAVGDPSSRSLTESVRSVERVAGEWSAAAAEAEGQRGRFERALHAIPHGVVVCDIDGQPVFRNQAASTYVAARHGEALVEVAVRELLADAVAGLPGSRALDLFGPPRRSLVINALPLGGDPRPAGAVAVIEDVTGRRHLEAVRRDFVANISHELRTPIAALALLAETLLAEDDAAVRDRLAERMFAEADRMGRTVEDLLTLSQIESEEAPEHEVVPVRLILDDAVARIRPAAEQLGIEIDLAPANPRLGVVGDRRQLVSALYNLLDNAVKYSGEGRMVHVRAHTNGRTVDLSVEDHGIGIPTGDLERIFERFYRVDQARSRQTGGTGLGLAIVRHVATNHDGDVRVESRAGEGSTFSLRIPIAPGMVAIDTAEAG